MSGDPSECLAGPSVQNQAYALPGDSCNAHEGLKELVQKRQERYSQEPAGAIFATVEVREPDEQVKHVLTKGCTSFEAGFAACKPRLLGFSTLAVEHAGQAQPGTIPTVRFFDASSQLTEMKYLAKGSSGAVHSCKLYGQDVAMKSFARKPKNAAELKDMQDSFHKEAAMLLTLKDQPHILQMEGLLMAGHEWAIVTELGDHSLRELCEKARNTESLATRLGWYLQIATALKHMHFLKIIHADLKPDNILLFKDRTVKVCDVGDAMEVSSEMFFAPQLTMRYRPPEVIKGLPTNMSSDVYSLGLVMHEMETGIRPWDAYDTAAQVIIAVVYGNQKVPLHTAEMPNWLGDLITSCVDPDLSQPGHVKRPTLDYIIQLLQSKLEVEMDKAKVK